MCVGLPKKSSYGVGSTKAFMQKHVQQVPDGHLTRFDLPVSPFPAQFEGILKRLSEV